VSSDPVALQTEESELKHVEQFEDDDDNDNDSDDVEDVSVHGSWITRRYLRRQAICSSRAISLPPHPAVPGAILNDLCERMGDLVEKQRRFRHFRCLVREASATQAEPKSAPRLSD
jgi:hypothetical protein